MTREAEFGPTQEVLDPKGRFRSALSLPFTTGETDAGELRLDVAVAGSDVTMYCFILQEETELGVSSLRIAELIFAGFEEDGLELSAQRILSIDAGAIGDATCQSLYLSFDLRDDEGKGGLGTMKAASANKLGHAIACNHWGAGYVETFARAFAELVGNFETNDPPLAPFYVEISRIQVNDLVVGVTSTRLVRDDDGDIQSSTESSMLIPTSADEFQATHSKVVDWTRGDGSLINAYDFEADVDGEVTSLALTWNDESGWKVEGMFGRKEIAEQLGRNDRLASSVSEALALRYQLEPSGEQARVTIDRWIPGVDPTRASVVTISVDEEDAGLATIELGPTVMTAQRDEDGLPERFTWSLGSNRMVIERIYRSGDL
jgi:hypothetical protein